MLQFNYNNLMFTVLFISFSQFSSAQIGVLSGKVNDENEEVMSFAHVLLLRQQDSVLVKGVTTNTAGRFSIESIPFGNYVLNISLLGYEPFFRNISIMDSEEFSLGTIQLTVSRQQLQGVQVVGKKALFQQKNDRLIVNVSSLPTFSGNNALQVLQKAPGVIVRENANSISLNNKGEVLVMINDRVSRVPPGTLIQQLKGMQAENIDRIEIIHQPSAKYDSNNAAGIIHIVLKERKITGLSGNASLIAGIGQREKGSGSLDLNYRNNGLNIYGTITGSHNKSPLWQLNHFREYEYEGNLYFYENQLLYTDPRFVSSGFTMGADLEIDDDNIIGALFGYSSSNMSGQDFRSSSRGTINGIPDLNSEFLLDLDNPNRNIFVNLNYFRRLGTNSSLNLDVDRVVLDTENFSGLSNLNPEAENQQVLADRDSRFEIYTAKGDFEHEWENGSKLEVGLKGTFNHSNTVSQARNRAEEIWSEDPAFQTDQDIDETILATYATYKKKWNEKWETSLGIRLENYKYQLNDVLGENDFEVTYTNPFPVVRASYAIDSVRKVTASFNRRIERPDFLMLVGYYVLIDPSLTVFSNTRLRPSFTNSARLAYNHRSFLIAFEINRTVGAISWYNTVDKESGVQTSTPINFDRMDGLLLSMSFPVKIGEIWKMNWNLDGAYKKVKDASNRPLPFEKGLITVTAQLTNIFEFGNSWTANVDVRYISPHMSGDQVYTWRPYVNFGISKKFGNESTLTFSIQDITATSGIIDWEYDQPELGIRTFGDNDWSERVFQLTYSFPFGNQKVKEKRNRKIGSQEERDRM
ncbi:outer membrane beta-barrel protein [Kriegella sp. EG-1]|nr:outer membrane beta-barrel protein [Flavobacteriaceae bacterium EG-1]